MVMCCVVGCSNRTVRDTVSFYRFPKCREKASPKTLHLFYVRRNLWLCRIGRKDLMFDDKKVDNSRVCSKHFIKGQPAAATEFSDPDWAPTLHLGHTFFSEEEPSQSRLTGRSRKTINRRKQSTPGKVSSSSSVNEHSEDSESVTKTVNESKSGDMLNMEESEDIIFEDVSNSKEDPSSQEVNNEGKMQGSASSSSDVSPSKHTENTNIVFLKKDKM